MTGEVDNQFATEVLALRELLHRNWQMVIKHVYREANRAANFLANRCHNFALGSHEFSISDVSFGYVFFFFLQSRDFHYPVYFEY
ncbi:hypothetical protein LINPERPRIM_LOCUS32863 [Linum perenne]